MIKQKVVFLEWYSVLANIRYIQGASKRGYPEDKVSLGRSIR